MIEVEALRKEYGDLVAVNDVSFSVRRGEASGPSRMRGSGEPLSLQTPNPL